MKITFKKLALMLSTMSIYAEAKPLKIKGGLAHGAKGFSILEVLVAIGLLGIVMASSAKVILVSMQANKATRTYASVIADVHDIVDNYRGQSYVSLLSLFNSDYSAITDGQTYSTTISSSRSRANYDVTLTAQKSSSNANPEIIEVRIQAEHRRGAFDNADYEFVTLISQSR